MWGRELAIREAGVLDLREAAARTTLREVRQKGHEYVELRRAGKRTIFFCTLCLTPCYNDTVLFDHLRGKLHTRRFAAAKITLFGPVPWPFNDGVLFFNTSKQTQKSIHMGGLLMDSNHSEDTIESVDDNCHDPRDFDHQIVANDQLQSSQSNGSNDKMPECHGITIPRVLINEQVSDLQAFLLGIGQISSRVRELDDGLDKLTKIWCAWLEQGDIDSSEGLNNCDFAILSFSYSDDLGRKEGINNLLSGSLSENDAYRPEKRGRTLLLGDSSHSVTNQCVVVEESLCLTRSSAIRRKLRKRKRKRMTPEKTCDICAQSILPGKDVATLLNCKTGRLACSSRNTNGAFHIYHVSCLVHWILLCEYEMWTDRTINVKPARGRKNRAVLKKCVSSVFCPECQGTGRYLRGGKLEKPTVALAEMFLYKLKAIKAHKVWMKNPEVLPNCSTGLHFPSDPEENLQERVMPVKTLRFYRADA